MLKKTAIVTGANGFVGSATTRELIAHGYKVYATDREGCNDRIPVDSPSCVFVPCELANMEGLASAIPYGEADVMFHFAWAGSAGPMRADPRVQLQNAQWTIDALTLAHTFGCRRFVCAGSIMEHETIAAGYAQGNRPGLGYVYGSGKLVAHTMCMCIAAKLGIDLVWGEITNAYGVGERSERLVNLTIRKCIRKEIPQFTAATQNYDFVYIDDIARAFRLIGEKGRPFHEYLIGSSSARPLKDFLMEMKRAIAPDLDFVFGEIPFTGVDLPLSKFDCSQTERDTGFRASVGFAEGCRRTWAWWKEELSKGRS